jgi:hypothetical protein
MKCNVIGEYGYEQAMLGVSLSWASNVERSKQIAPNLAHKQGGHNKFLEMMYIWIDVTFPRGVWQEADTYRLTTKQSASTMHTITKNNLTQDNFETQIFHPTLEYLNILISEYNVTKNKDTFLEIKNNLPEGFLQRRIWCMSYKTLQNIYFQRINHKLPYWKQFLEIVLSEIRHPEFIVKQS